MLSLAAQDPVDIVRHRYVFIGDAVLGVCHQCEFDGPPTDVDVGVVVLSFGVLGHPANSVDTGEEGGKFDRPAQRTVGPLPAVELGQCGVYLLIGQHSHLPNGIPSLAMPNQIVVAGAVLSGNAVLVAQRRRPSELAGRWELPGGKVGPGETETDALARELAEELGVGVAVGDRLGDDIKLTEATTLRAYQVRLISGEPHPHDHQALRWVTAAQLADLDWVPADRDWLSALRQVL